VLKKLGEAEGYSKAEIELYSDIILRLIKEL